MAVGVETTGSVSMQASAGTRLAPVRSTTLPKILTGGQVPPGINRGFYFEPTVLVNVDHSMPLMREETFGPIAPIVGAIIGACITAGVTYLFIYKRKVVTFWVSETEDLTLPLRQHHSFVIFKVANFEILNQVRSQIRVWICYLNR